MASFFHPETGEIIETKEEFLDALHALEERLAPIYRYRAKIREQYAARFPAAEQPAPRYRTAVQEKVSRCPRCGTHLSERTEDGASGDQ